METNKLLSYSKVWKTEWQKNRKQ